MPLNKTEKDKLLQTEIVYLATSDLIGKPHLKPIWYVYDKGKIWFETDKTTRAYKNIKENNKIMLCFGGRETYLVWGKVKWYEEKECPIPFRKMLWDKYGEDMDDSYITYKTYIFEVIPSKEMSWHYVDQDWE
ncbi:hypothetical protein A3A76_03255 [Candidatus Woesebacteria bacterium RIFCSPLOWO2_01_FULL_39_23]|uniref:Pyridoxamine 5'-phosphate oxidase N-terminal domain-containing protein n=1 Tax=Candidatus Woesebacteria bacterium RIFCSPHIGHO2_01_FULL_40_22 TaxID=1802499 RepID=A0A1F7YKS3_9BACT|nr:MAG: hypothetical protein A2141_00770 [Candidatus Woesebacteria bacterium RBG_16_40_11]OGM27479.1 MAG: hypothetical protein A2628_01655 [Candidatus Woesebacteria bacterium RIFCSPHIGHO2_01_FULL_40_22]OGM36564.1 MAG: hypothetical protein A3E41_03990 [Candidatus Woesebacteria bacterium RIFCSPHIGHO2_12_FULL_38_9]OGM62653.1 MAG: hypothetical protein A3A76_03255 [Candidatus Woesebacteria bacterium RIFCSPLOWO2_01_FULL_39_23]